MSVCFIQMNGVTSSFDRRRFFCVLLLSLIIFQRGDTQLSSYHHPHVSLPILLAAVRFIPAELEKREREREREYELVMGGGGTKYKFEIGR
jgi:hypothetical protein